MIIQFNEKIIKIINMELESKELIKLKVIIMMKLKILNKRLIAILNSKLKIGINKILIHLKIRWKMMAMKQWRMKIMILKTIKI